MKFLSRIPGFRKKKAINKLIATIYYSFFIGSALGMPNFKESLFYLSFIFIPYLVFEGISSIKEVIGKSYKFEVHSLINLSIILFIIIAWILPSGSALISKDELEEYKSLAKKIEDSYEESSRYYDENYEDISKYLDLRVEYEEVYKEFEEYKIENPESLLEDVKQAKEDVNKYYAQATELKNKVASSSFSTQSSSPSNNNNNSSNKNESNRYIGKSVYISNGNSYYHAISSCKFLQGASAKAVDLNNVGGKHACNCVKYL